MVIETLDSNIQEELKQSAKFYSGDLSSESLSCDDDNDGAEQMIRMPMQIQVRRSNKQSAIVNNDRRELLNCTFDTNMTVPKEGSIIQTNESSHHRAKNPIQNSDDGGYVEETPMMSFCQKMTPVRVKSHSQSIQTSYSKHKVNKPWYSLKATMASSNVKNNW